MPLYFEVSTCWGCHWVLVIWAWLSNSNKRVDFLLFVSYILNNSFETQFTILITSSLLLFWLLLWFSWSNFSFRKIDRLWYLWFPKTHYRACLILLTCMKEIPIICHFLFSWHNLCNRLGLFNCFWYARNAIIKFAFLCLLWLNILFINSKETLP